MFIKTEVDVATIYVKEVIVRDNDDVVQIYSRGRDGRQNIHVANFFFRKGEEDPNIAYPPRMIENIFLECTEEETKAITEMAITRHLDMQLEAAKAAE